MKKLLVVLLSFICSIVIGIYYPKIFDVGAYDDVNMDVKSLVPQEMIEMVEEPVEVIKVYYEESLIGVISSSDIMEEIKKEAYETLYAEKFPDVELRFNDGIYVVPEKSHYIYENKDQEIKQYFFDNDLFLVNAYRVTFISEKSEKSIYVKSMDDFKASLKRYILNFIDEDTYNLLDEGKIISDIVDYGTKNMSLSISEKITSELVSAPASEIKLTQDDIFDYLCYSDNTKLTYYTVLAFDTIEGIAELSKLSIDQLLSINPSLESADQVLQEGEKINITYFNSPITITVLQQRLVAEPIYRDAAHYIQDTSKPGSYYEVETVGEDGNRNTLYTDVYVNGKLVSYKQESSIVTKEPITEVIRVGTSYQKIESELDWILPVDNPYIICNMYCYEGHRGVDFKNRYITYADVYSVEAGVVIDKGYDEQSGNFISMKIANYYVIYAHFNKPAYVEIGDTVERHQLIGQMGRTGVARSVHVHIGIYQDRFEIGYQIHPCSVLPCEIIGK